MLEIIELLPKMLLEKAMQRLDLTLIVSIVKL
jgi:hypothetical protein